MMFASHPFLAPAEVPEEAWLEADNNDTIQLGRVFRAETQVVEQENGNDQCFVHLLIQLDDGSWRNAVFTQPIENPVLAEV